MSDNFHQSVMGGTGANHIMLGFGDAIWFSDGNGNPEIPPHNVEVFSGTPNAGVVDEIEDPNPQADTITGTRKMAMAVVASASRSLAAVRTPTARIRLRRELAQSMDT